MKLELVKFESTDKLELPGLLYQPIKNTPNVVLWLHGNGDSGILYNQKLMNALGKSLTDNDITFFAFNNRGAHQSKKLHIADDSLTKEDQYIKGGASFEKIADCVHDIDGAVAYLKGRGFTEFYLAGTSTGANKICAYHVRTKDNPFSKYILAAAADDSGIYYSELGEEKFSDALSYAKKSITDGEPLKIMPEDSGMYPISTQSTVDMIDPDGDYNTFPFYEYTHARLGTKPLFSEYQKLDKPMLVMYGANDEYTYTAGGTNKAIGVLKKNTNPNCPDATFEVIADADHGFHGHETDFAEKIATWLSK